MPALVATVASGETVPLTVLRNEKNVQMQVMIGEFDADKLALANGESIENSALGLTLEEPTAEQLTERGLDQGVMVSNVALASAAAKAGVQVGDVTLSLAGKQTNSISDINDISKKLDSGKSIPMLVDRGGRALYLALSKAKTME